MNYQISQKYGKKSSFDIEDFINMGCCFNDNNEEIKNKHEINLITKINLNNKYLTSIPKCLIQCHNLKELKLSNNYIRKIENLENLLKIERLDLSKNHIEKIENLNNLNKLKFLYLSRNNIKKIENLNNCKKLEYVVLDFNKINKIEGLDNLNNLVFLNLNQNKITKIEGLDHFIKENKDDFSITQNKFESFEIYSNPLKYSKYKIKIFENENTLNLNCNVSSEEIEEYYVNYLEKRKELLDKRKKLHQQIKNKNYKKGKQFLKEKKESLKENNINTNHNDKSESNEYINFGF